MGHSSGVLYVAHYGHEKLKGAKHWSFLHYRDDPFPISIQLSGSTSNYVMKRPKKVWTFDSVSYMGKVEVGFVSWASYHDMVALLEKEPIVHGDLQWNCQDWIVGSLKLLRENGYDVQSPTKAELADRLEKVDVFS